MVPIKIHFITFLFELFLIFCILYFFQKFIISLLVNKIAPFPISKILEYPNESKITSQINFIINFLLKLINV